MIQSLNTRNVKIFTAVLRKIYAHICAYFGFTTYILVGRKYTLEKFKMHEFIIIKPYYYIPCILIKLIITNRDSLNKHIHVHCNIVLLCKCDSLILLP